MTLYTKIRPKTFDEVKGQEFTVNNLRMQSPWLPEQTPGTPPHRLSHAPPDIHGHEIQFLYKIHKNPSVLLTFRSRVLPLSYLTIITFFPLSHQ